MPRPSLRESIIQAGIVTVLERGFNGAGVRDVMAAADAPQGSFTNHFRSKEAFGLVVLDRYFEGLQAIAEATLADTRRTPIQRLDAYFDAVTEHVEAVGWRNGCMISNLSLEAAEHSDLLRARLSEILRTLTRYFADVVRSAQDRGQIEPALDPDDVGTVLLAGWHGALLRMKVDRSPEPLAQFRRVTASTLMRLGS